MSSAVCIWNSNRTSLSYFEVTGVNLWMKRVKPAYNFFLSASLPLLLKELPKCILKGKQQAKNC